MSNKMLRNYVSEIDQFLQKFDKEHPIPTLSQQKEIDKYQRIYELRDDVAPTVEVKIIWEKF